MQRTGEPQADDKSCSTWADGGPMSRLSSGQHGSSLFQLGYGHTQAPGELGIHISAYLVARAAGHELTRQHRKGRILGKVRLRT